MRNPADRAYSHYLNLKTKSNVNDTEFSIAFEDKIKETHRIIEEGYYYDLLKRYYDNFPRENILVLLFDDIEKNGTEFLKKIYSFLGVDPGVAPPIANQKINASATKLGKFQSIYILYKGFMKFGFYALADKVDKLNKKDNNEIPHRLKKWLIQEKYLKQIELLEALIHQDLTAWKRV